MAPDNGLVLPGKVWRYWSQALFSLQQICPRRGYRSRLVRPRCTYGNMEAAIAWSHPPTHDPHLGFRWSNGTFRSPVGSKNCQHYSWCIGVVSKVSGDRPLISLLERHHFMGCLTPSAWQPYPCYGMQACTEHRIPLADHKVEDPANGIMFQCITINTMVGLPPEKLICTVLIGNPVERATFSLISLNNIADHLSDI